MGYSVSRAHKPGISHCYEGIFDILMQSPGNCTRNHGTIIIAFKTCVPNGAHEKGIVGSNLDFQIDWYN